MSIRPVLRSPSSVYDRREHSAGRRKGYFRVTPIETKRHDRRLYHRDNQTKRNGFPRELPRLSGDTHSKGKRLLFHGHAARARRRGGRPEHTLVAEAGVFSGSVSQSAASAASNARRMCAASSRQSRATSGMMYARRSVALPRATEEPGRETPSQTVALRGGASSEVR